MKNNQFYFYEERHYIAEELTSKLGRKCLEQLKSKKICEEVSAKVSIKFTFVGIVNYKDMMIVVVPKYVEEKDEEKLFNIMHGVLKVIGKYNNKFYGFNDKLQLIDSGPAPTTSFSVASYLLEDYSQHGFFVKTEESAELNGEGEIDWDSTLDDVLPVLSLGVPYYVDFIRNNNYFDEKNIVTRIHKWAIFHYSSVFGKWLGYNEVAVEQENKSLAAIGNKEYLVSQLQSELNQTYIDDRIILLKLLISLVKNNLEFTSSNMDIFGTKNFNYIWEDVCRSVFNDERDIYMHMIPSPLWFDLEANVIEKETFKPDIIKVYSFGGEKIFSVLDAKYYNFKFTKNGVSGNPSVNDVSKQLLYVKAFSGLNFKTFRNYFLLPTHSEENHEILNVIGKVSMDFINTDPVILVYVSADKVYNMYLNNDILSDDTYLNFELQTQKKI